MAEFRKSVYGGEVYKTDVAQAQASPSANPNSFTESKTVLIGLLIGVIAVSILIFLLFDSRSNPNYPSQKEIFRVTPPTSK